MGYNKGHKVGDRNFANREDEVIKIADVTIRYVRKKRFSIIPLIYKIVFKNASPLGFMIVLLYVKQGSAGDKNGFTPLKTKLHTKKTKFTYDLLIFMTCLSKILENDSLSGMIKFRKFFEMIFHFGNALLSKIQAHYFLLSYAPYFKPENHPFFMIKKMKNSFVMIRGKSPPLPK